MIGIVDLGGNYGSLLAAFDRLGVPARIGVGDVIILPGVGRAGVARSRLPALPDVSVLGICVGYHILCRHSEEDDTKGVGIFDSVVRKLPAPRFGWGETEWGWMYFCHEYSTGQDAECNGRFTGVQFHPEKSGKSGREFLRQWLVKSGEILEPEAA